jgi:hypothetical protein
LGRPGGEPGPGQLPADPLVPPAWVLRAEADDEVPDVEFDRRPAGVTRAESGERRNTHEIGELRWVVEDGSRCMPSVRRSRG